MIDRIISLIVLIFICPFLLIISLIIYFSDGFPILFIQSRIGKNGKKFKLFKFRTMKNNTPEISTNDLNNYKKYLLKHGKILRKYSLDELPNVLNIFLGNLRFIGYRPALKKQYFLNKKRKELGIFNFYPGLTGLAQVSGRDKLSDAEKIKYEKEYIENKSFMLKLRIIILTLIMFIKPKNVKE